MDNKDEDAAMAVLMKMIHEGYKVKKFKLIPKPQPGDATSGSQGNGGAGAGSGGKPGGAQTVLPGWRLWTTPVG